MAISMMATSGVKFFSRTALLRVAIPGLCHHSKIGLSFEQQPQPVCVTGYDRPANRRRMGFIRWDVGSEVGDGKLDH